MSKMRTRLGAVAMAIAVAISAGSLSNCGRGELGTTIYSEGLRFCEGSVPYGSTLLISNFGTESLSPFNNEGKGYIMQLERGELKSFITADGNLSAPKGMAVKDDYLYIADVGKIVVYNLQKRCCAPTIVRMPRGCEFANDIAISGQNAYISVTSNGKIFKLDISSPATLSEKDLSLYTTVAGANGLVIDGNTMYVASYPANGVVTPANVIYEIKDMNAPVAQRITERAGRYDGIAKSGDRLYFTSWSGNEFGYLDLCSAEVIVKDLGLGEEVALAGPADMSILDGAIYIPDLASSRLVKIGRKALR